MKRLSKWILFLSLGGALLGCGVKGRPLPPLQPAPIGLGEPSLKESPAKKPSKKKNSIDAQDEEELHSREEQ